MNSKWKSKINYLLLDQNHIQRESFFLDLILFFLKNKIK